MWEIKTTPLTLLLSQLYWTRESLSLLINWNLKPTIPCLLLRLLEARKKEVKRQTTNEQQQPPHYLRCKRVFVYTCRNHCVIVLYLCTKNTVLCLHFHVLRWHSHLSYSQRRPFNHRPNWHPSSPGVQKLWPPGQRAINGAARRNHRGTRQTDSTSVYSCESMCVLVWGIFTSVQWHVPRKVCTNAELRSHPPKALRSPSQRWQTLTLLKI